MLIETDISREARSISTQTPPGPTVPATLVVSNITRPAPATLVVSAASRTERAVALAEDLSLGPAKSVIVSAAGRKARSFLQGAVFIVARGGIAVTSNLLKGDGTGNAADSGVNPASLVETFLELSDTPADYIGQGSKAVSVRADELGLEFTAPGGGSPAILVESGSEEKISAMTAATSLGGADVFPVVQSSANKKSALSTLVTYLQSALTFVTTFLGLTDTPSSYSGQASKVVSVKSDETGLEFTTPASPGAPTDAHYVTTQAESGLSNEFNLGGLTGGLLKQAVSSGVSTPAIATPKTDFWDTTDFVASGAGHAHGLVPDPGASAGATKYLREDATWDVPPNSGVTGSKGDFHFFAKRNAGLSVGKGVGYWTSKFAGAISAWNITVDGGTITIKIWKIATGTAHPTSADSITATGLSLSTGTNIRSTDVSGFSTLAVAIGDIFAWEITAVSGVFDFGGSIEITRT